LTTRSSRPPERVDAPSAPGPAPSPQRQPAVKRESSFHQINKRVVSGLYIDSVRTAESPKKSLVEQLHRSPRQGPPFSPHRETGAEMMHHSPPARPTRRPPPSPPVAPRFPQSSPRGGEVGPEPIPKSGGANRGPQYYRDLLLASRERAPHLSSPERYRPETTTQSYLFSPPQPTDRREGADRTPRMSRRSQRDRF
jgi:hypothetical protein